MSSPIITRQSQSRTALLLGDKKKIKAIFTLYRVAQHNDMKSYTVWSEHPDPLSHSPLYY